MIAYVDSSVLLRIVLRQPHALKEWRRIEKGVASSLVEVECLHTLDRVRLRTRMTDKDLALRRDTIFRLLDAMELVEPSRSVLARASQPLPTELGTLDAIHLTTAMLWREASVSEVVMATHDEALGTAARAQGFAIIGLG